LNSGWSGWSHQQGRRTWAWPLLDERDPLAGVVDWLGEEVPETWRTGTGKKEEAAGERDEGRQTGGGETARGSSASHPWKREGHAVGGPTPTDEPRVPAGPRPEELLYMVPERPRTVLHYLPPTEKAGMNRTVHCAGYCDQEEAAVVLPGIRGVSTPVLHVFHLMMCTMPPGTVQPTLPGPTSQH